MSASFIMDGVTISLCLLTVGYCYFLNRQIRGLRNSKSGIGTAIEQMNRCIGDLQGSFIQAKQAVEKQSEILSDRLDEGGSLADHMGVLVRQANRALVALESGIARTNKIKEEAVNERKRIESLLKDDSRLSVQAHTDALLNTFFQKGTEARNMAQELDESLEKEGFEVERFEALPEKKKENTSAPASSVGTENLENVLSKKIASSVKGKKNASKSANQIKAESIAALMREFPEIPADNYSDPLEDVMPKGLDRLTQRLS